MKLDIKTGLILLLVIGLAFFFYPKPRVVGGLSGFVWIGQTAYPEEYNCLGIPTDYCNPNVRDGGCDHLCYGLTYNRTCYNQTAGIGKVLIACEDIPMQKTYQPVPNEGIGTKID